MEGEREGIDGGRERRNRWKDREKEYMEGERESKIWIERGKMDGERKRSKKKRSLKLHNNYCYGLLN